MALFGRDYDRNYGAGRNNYDRGMRGRAQHMWNETKDETSEAFGRDRDRDRNYGGNMNRGYGTAGPAYGYDRNYGATGYDRGYKSRTETDYGDPFGDRQNRTPIRVMRGEYEGGGYDRNYSRNNNNNNNTGRTGYDRNYSANPMGYDPYYNNSGYDNQRRSAGGMRGYDRDRGMF